MHPALSRNCLALLLPVLALSGCIHVNLPEHMVSDTVGAGKQLYTTIAQGLQKEPALGTAEHRGATFVLRQLGNTDTTVTELKRSCVKELVTQARTTLAAPQLDYTVVSEAVDTKDSSVVVKCEISVKS